jgi:hypothetical protein
VHRGQRGQSFVYELVYDGDGSAAPYLSGLIDVATMATSRGSEAENAGSSRPARGVNAAPSRPLETPPRPSAATPAASTVIPPRQAHVMGTSLSALPSYPSSSRVA